MNNFEQNFTISTLETHLPSNLIEHMLYDISLEDKINELLSILSSNLKVLLSDDSSNNIINNHKDGKEQTLSLEYSKELNRLNAIKLKLKNEKILENLNLLLKHSKI